MLIDEGHDFEPEWLKLAAQMVDPGDQQPAAAVRRCAEHLPAPSRAAVQLQERGHPGPGPHHGPEDQLPQHPADTADRQPDGRRAAHGGGQRRRRRAAAASDQLRPRWPTAAHHPAAHPARRSGQDRRTAGRCPPGRPRLGRHGRHLPPPHRHGALRRSAAGTATCPTRCARAPAASIHWTTRSS